ncbi:aldehyde dehydrogenase [Verrucomicrobiota bacterium]
MTSKTDWVKKAEEIKPNGKAFIDGQYIAAENNEVFSRKSPVDGRMLASVASCSVNDIDKAVSAARKAFEDGRWYNKKPVARKEILFNFTVLIEKHAAELALLDTLSMGKPVGNCLNNDIPLAVRCIRWYAEAIDKLYDKCVPRQPGVLGTITREPLGVAGAITPWNYPMENVAWKIGPALAAGNSLVLKPAEQSSLSSIYLGQLAAEAGIPDGVLNIVPGPGEITGKALALHDDVDGIFFTGSSAVGKKVMQYSGQSNMKRVAVECGGKSAFIVLKDCGRLEEAAEVLAKNIFFNQGQTCSAPSRLIIEKALHDEMLELLLKHLPDYQPGNPLDEKTTIGAMVSHEHLEKVLNYIKIGNGEGAKLIAGGNEAAPVKGGAYITPAIFDEVNNNMRIAQEEIFGPVLSIITAKNEMEAVKLANESSYGLAGAVWCDNIDIAHRTAGKIRAGTVHINCYGEDDITAPFGGYKLSGNGSKDKALHSFDDYTELKTTWLKLRKAD